MNKLRDEIISMHTGFFKCISHKLFKEVVIGQSWLDDTRNTNAEIFITNNDNSTTRMIIKIDNGKIIPLLPFQGLCNTDG